MATQNQGRLVGPIDFEGPAVALEASVREDNNFAPVDVERWYANTQAQKAEMEAAEARFFAEIEGRKTA